MSTEEEKTTKFEWALNRVFLGRNRDKGLNKAFHTYIAYIHSIGLAEHLKGRFVARFFDTLSERESIHLEEKKYLMGKHLKRVFR